MDAQLKAEWVEALRSGEFKQTYGSLFDGENYCCLGVLCRVAGLPIRADGSGVEGASGDPDTLSSYDPIFNLVGGIDKSHPLSMRNDGLIGEDPRKHSFAEIADFIEANL